MPEAARKAEAQEAHLLAQETAPRKQRGTVQIRLGMVEDGRGRNQQAERWFARACRHKCYRKVGWLWVLRGANLPERSGSGWRRSAIGTPLLSRKLIWMKHTGTSVTC